MSEKTLVQQPGDAAGSQAFRYREDYLLFGLLVRHGICKPGDHDALVDAQARAASPQPLADFLADVNRFTPKQRSNVAELLKVLANPELAKLLPDEMPELRTLVDRYFEREATQPGERRRGSSQPAVSPHDATEVEPEGPTAVPFGSSKTVRLPSKTVGLSQLSLDDYTSASLSHEEIARLQSARHKSSLIGNVIAGHVIIDRIGSGGQGDVYLAKQLSLDRYVALKKLEVPANARPQLFIEAFRREAITLGKINHARIVKVYEIFLEGDNALFTMEFLKGRTLKDIVAESGPMAPEVAANIACQACSALGRTAEDKLVHRDIKPANIMLDENGDVKIVDFGLAGASASFMKGGAFSGTPQYAAPEQIKLEELSPAADQYSLGATLFYCLTGEAPFTGKKMQDVLDQHVHQPVRVPSTVNTALPRSVDRVLLRMMEKDPAKRFASFDECFAEWEKILNDASKKTAGSVQLLGDSLLRLSKQERSALITRSSVLVGAWLLLVTGTLLGEWQLRVRQMAWVLQFCGDYGTYLLIFSLSCIFYVAAARRGFLPTVGSLRAWLYTHIATAIPAVAMILLHSGNFLRGAMPGGDPGKPLLTILVSTVLLITATSGSVGLVIFRALRKQMQLDQLALRGSANVDQRQVMMTVLSARLLSGWRLVHYPLAVLFILLSLVHILQSLKFALR